MKKKITLICILFLFAYIAFFLSIPVIMLCNKRLGSFLAREILYNCFAERALNTNWGILVGRTIENPVEKIFLFIADNMMMHPGSKPRGSGRRYFETNSLIDIVFGDGWCDQQAYAAMNIARSVGIKGQFYNVKAHTFCYLFEPISDNTYGCDPFFGVFWFIKQGVPSDDEILHSIREASAYPEGYIPRLRKYNEEVYQEYARLFIDKVPQTWGDDFWSDSLDLKRRITIFITKIWLKAFRSYAYSIALNTHLATHDYNYLSEVIKKTYDSGNPDIELSRLFYNARVYHLCGDLDKALDFYNRAINYDKHGDLVMPLRAFKGKCLRDIGKYSEAKRILSQITNESNWYDHAIYYLYTVDHLGQYSEMDRRDLQPMAMLSY